MKKCFFLILLLSFFFSCGKKDSYIYLLNRNWPDGTVLNLYKGDKHLSDSVIYGNHIRFAVKDTGEFILRIANKDYLTVLFDIPKVTTDNLSLSLPSPIQKKRVGSWRIGLVFRTDIQNVDYSEFIAQNPESFTTIYPELFKNGYLNETVRKSHEKGIEIIAKADISGNESESIKTAIDSSVVYGIDGILLNVTLETSENSRKMKNITEYFKSIHEKQLLAGLTFTLDDIAKNEKICKNLKDMFKGQKSDYQPDFICFSLESVNFEKDKIEDMIKNVKNDVPISKILIDIKLSAVKKSVSESESGKSLIPEPGEIENIIKTAGENGIIHVQDGSLRLGYGGYIYIFDNMESISGKIKSLRDGILSHSSGITVSFEKEGVYPDSKEFVKLSEVLKAQ